MIEIKLTENEAIDFLDKRNNEDSSNEKLLEDYETLRLNYDNLSSDYDALKAKYDTLSTQEDVSSRVRRDTELANSLRTKVKPKPFKVREQPEVVAMKSTSWQSWEVDKLTTATDATAPSLNNINWLHTQLPNRSLGSIRSKLSSIGISVVKSKLIRK